MKYEGRIPILETKAESQKKEFLRGMCKAYKVHQALQKLKIKGEVNAK